MEWENDSGWFRADKELPLTAVRVTLNVHHPERGCAVFEGYFTGEWKFAGGKSIGSWEVTHWMPLPKSPTPV